MNNSEGLKPFQQSLAGLPQWVSERILQQINQLTRYEPVIGIMGKTGVGKSSLCNALFAGDISPVSDVAACTRSQLINSIDILRARRATGLMTRDNYRTVNNITQGKHPEAKQ